MEIKIQHQSEKSFHTFAVVDADKLTPVEVWAIRTEMNVTAILVNRKYYQCN